MEKPKGLTDDSPSGCRTPNFEKRSVHSDAVPPTITSIETVESVVQQFLVVRP